MIVANQAELMLMAQPGFQAINGLAGLGCGGDKSCGCGCKSKGMGDITDRNDVGMFFCNWTPLRWFEACSVPSQEDIIKSKSDYGGSLSPENQAVAEGMATTIINHDCQSNPELYTQVPGSCSYEGNKGLLYIALGLGALLLLRG